MLSMVWEEGFVFGYVNIKSKCLWMTGEDPGREGMVAEWEKIGRFALWPTVGTSEAGKNRTTNFRSF